jgi:hypothetical protein
MHLLAWYEGALQGQWPSSSAKTRPEGGALHCLGTAHYVVLLRLRFVVLVMFLLQERKDACMGLCLEEALVGRFAC